MPPFAFTPGLSVPLSRPRPFAVQRCPRPFYLQTRASVDEPARQAADKALSQTPASPETTFGALPPVLRGLAGAAIVAGTSAAAFFATPPRQYARPGASVVGGVAAVAAVVSMRGGAKKATKRKLARLVAELGTDGQLAAAVQDMAKGIGADDFAEIKREMYELYLLATVDAPGVLYREISHLIRLKTALALGGDDVGDAHFEACRAFYRANVIFLDAEDDQVSKTKAQNRLDKLVFLSDRMYADKETEEAYRYERSRLRKFFRMEEDEYEERVERVALPFYKEVIVKACLDSSVVEEDLQAAQATLGIKDIAAERIRADAYAGRVDSLMSQKGKLDAADNESLSRLRGLLGIADDRASSTLETLAEPVFRVEVVDALDALKKGEESMASIYGRLALRQTELSYPANAARAAMAREMSSRASQIVRTASKFLRVQNVNGCILQLRELLSFADGIIGLVRVSDDDYKEDTELLKTFLPEITGSLSQMEPTQMYRIFLSKCLEDRQISAEEEIQLTRLRTLLSLTESDSQNAFRAAAGPVYRKAVSDAVSNGKVDEETKSNIIKLKEGLALPVKTSKSIDVELYRSKLRKLVDGNRIIQEHEAQELFVLREFLDIKPEDAAPVHKSVMGPVYEQSVTEAMGPTGIMLDEYKSGLERLRDRLGLSEQDAVDSFNKVVKQRMLMYVNRALSQLEKRQTFRGQNEERDVGEDPNIKRAGAFLGIDAGGLPVELSNLVDFYIRNGLAKEEEVEVEGEKRTVTKYLVSLRGDIQPNVQTELYKQYVIQCFTAQTRGEKQRLFGVLDQLGSILGLQGEEVEKIHAEIGTVIYKNYVSQALLKGPIEDKDTEFLKNIQQMLSMKEDQCAGLLKDAKENRISVLLEQIFGQAKVLPETVKKMRNTAIELGVDIVKDLSVTKDQRKRLFGVEIDAAIDTGALSAENQSLIQEAKQGLYVDDDSAREVLLSCIQRRTLSHLVQAAASLRQNRSESAVAEMKAMLRYGKLLPSKVNAPAVSVSEKRDLYLLFQADVIIDDVIGESEREQVNLLKTMFGFVDADLELVS
eukprot:GFKZ01008083.1.p1 GENE.GFKZ01008083.1~~GFKZ01008083.1.p1  ORF type:complete len:1055 (-),score=199.96 GFKZ01008083.1:1463-4627(-)